MATNFTAFYLGFGGTANPMDPTEGNSVAETTTRLSGRSFGSTSNPLYTHTNGSAVGTVEIQLSSVDPQGDGKLTSNNTTGSDEFEVRYADGSNIRVSYDTMVRYNATITYADGTTANVMVNVVQAESTIVGNAADNNGQFYVFPETSTGANATALTAGPIFSIDLIGPTATQPSADMVKSAILATNFEYDGVISGTAGNDLIDGNYQDGSGADKIDNLDAVRPGTTGNDDFVTAGGGDDTVFGGLGRDTVDGGTGNDRLDGGAGSDSITGGIGADTIIGGEGMDTIHGGADADSIYAGVEDDIVTGGDGNDTIYGGGANDTLSGDLGDDWISGGEGADSIFGGDGNDAIEGDGAAEPGYYSYIGYVLGQNFVDYSPTGGSTSHNYDGLSITGDPVSITIKDDDGTLLSDNASDERFSDLTQTVLIDGVEHLAMVDQIVTMQDPATGKLYVFAQLDVDINDDTIANSGEQGNFNILLSDTPPPIGANLVTVSTQMTDLAYPTQAYNDTLSGDAGDDTIRGNGGNDLIYGGADSDALYGDAGADRIYGGTEADYIDGGDGNDSLVGDDGDDTILGGLGDDTVQGGAGNDSILGGDGNDQLQGNFGSDTIYGGLGADTISGGSQASFLSGDDGNDRIIGSTGDDTIYGGAGDDTIYGVQGGDSIEGGDGSDLIYGDHPNTALFGPGGADTIFGGLGADTIFGGDGGDSITGGDGDDSISGDAGADFIDAGAGDDWIDGGAGIDTISGGSGSDQIVVGGGDSASGGDDSDLFLIDGSTFSDGNIITIDGGTGSTGADDIDDYDEILFNGFTKVKGSYQGTRDSDGNSKSGTLQIENDATGEIFTVNFTEIEAPICFCRGTKIATMNGLIKVEDLRQGDLVLTLDQGYRPIIWLRGRIVSKDMLQAQPERFCPIRIAAGALGDNRPAEDLFVSPQHRILLRSPIAQRICGTREVLVAAKKLLNLPGVEQMLDVDEVEYYHFLFDDHQIVFANGAESESLFLGKEAIKSMPREAYEEIIALFPELAELDFKPPQARTFPTGRQTQELLRRHLMHSKAVYHESRPEVSSNPVND